MKQVFWKMKTFFQKTEVPFFSWKYEEWKRNILYKTALSETNVNGMVSTKWTYHKERSFDFKELSRCTNYSNVPIDTFRKHWSFIFECFFPVSILKSSFGKRILPNLTCVLIYSLAKFVLEDGFKYRCFLKIL